MNPIEFSSNLFSLRMEHKMSVEELAELLNVTPEAVCEWECAKTSPTMEQMDRLAKIYRIPLDQIVRNPKPRTEQPLPAEEILPEEPENTLTAEVPTGQISFSPSFFEEVEAEEEEDFDDEEEEVSLKPRRGKKPRRRWVDVAVIVLLLGIIAAATVFLINPEWFPWLK